MATVIQIKNLPEGYQSIISNGKHAIVGDEPLKSKGTDLGFSPSDLVLSGLALCKVATVRYIARLKNWEISDVKAKLIQEVTKSSTGLKTHVTIRIQIDGNIDEEQKQELTNQANSCYIHRQLMGEWNIDHAIEMTNFQLQSSNKI